MQDISESAVMYKTISKITLVVLKMLIRNTMPMHWIIDGTTSLIESDVALQC